MVQKTRSARGAPGFTLLELLIALFVASLLASSAVLALRGGYGIFQETSRSTLLEARVQLALDRVASELLGLGEAELDPNPVGALGTSDLVFRHALDLAGTNIVWGDRRRLVLDYDAAELDDGVDNDGDGLVDECVLRLTRNLDAPSEKTVVLCSGVQEDGFNVTRVGDVLVVTLALEDAAEDGAPIARELSTAVRLRN